MTWLCPPRLVLSSRRRSDLSSAQMPLRKNDAYRCFVPQHDKDAALSSPLGFVIPTKEGSVFCANAATQKTIAYRCFVPQLAKTRLCPPPLGFVIPTKEGSVFCANAATQKRSHTDASFLSITKLISMTKTRHDKIH